jgi:hypothetical protein
MASWIDKADRTAGCNGQQQFLSLKLLFETAAGPAPKGLW